MRTIRLILAYDGTEFSGWQKQPGVRTVQWVMEDRLARVLTHQVRIVGSGRTDAGVHALGQAASFSTDRAIPLEGLQRGLNSLLPDDVCVMSAEEVGEGFDAQRSARSKVYRYTIHNAPLPSVFDRNRTWHVRQPLDVAAMADAARHLVGRHDFSAFQASDKKPRSALREMRRAAVYRRSSHLVLVELEADGFVMHMVRNIVGSLADVGLSRTTPDRFREILAGRDRTKAGMTAPARGLCLVEVKYW